MKINYFVILFILLITSNLLPARKELRFSHLGRAEGLFQRKIQAFCLDNKGFMWIGTDSGLNRYDGRTCKLFRHNPDNPRSLSGNSVIALHEDQSGNLWIYSSDDTLNRFDRKSESFRRIPLGERDVTNPMVEILCPIRESADGHLWILSMHDDVVKFNPTDETFKIYPCKPNIPDSISDSPIMHIYLDRDGILWAGNLDSELIRFDPLKKTRKVYPYRGPIRKGKTKTLITSIYKDRQNTMWVSLHCMGLARFDPENGTFTNIPSPSLTFTDEYDWYFTRFIEPGDNNTMWLGSYGGGLVLFNRDTKEFTAYRASTEPDSLSNDYILSMYQEQNGMIWLGTRSSGIDIYNPIRERFSHYRHIHGNPNSLNNDKVYTIHEDADKTLWVGTAGGLNRMDREKGTVRHYKYNPDDPYSICNDSVTSLCIGKDGTLWVGTTNGLNAYDKKTDRFTPYFPIPGEANNRDNYWNYALLEDHKGEIWTGSGNGLSRVNREKQAVARFRKPNAPLTITERAVFALHEDNEHNLWIGTYGSGLYKLNPQRTEKTHFPLNPGNTGGNSVGCIHEDGNGVLWLGTGNGLSSLNPLDKNITRYSSGQGLPGDTILGILEDNQGNLWFCSGFNIYRFNPGTHEIKSFGLSDGVQDAAFSPFSYYRSPSGEMFFGGGNGFNAFFPHRIKENSNIPPVVITDFKLFNQPVPIGGDSLLDAHISETKKITLSYRQHMFGFQFAALDYTRPENNRYMYKMEGFHEDWIQLGNKNDVTFTGLPPGNYTFRVRGSNNDGAWNMTGTKLEIVITPPFWNATWFRLLSILVLAALAFTWHKKRMNRLYSNMKKEARWERLFEKHGISKREEEITRLILDGKSNKQVEDTLFISMSTVKSHVYNLYRKFGVQNRVELLNLFRQ